MKTLPLMAVLIYGYGIYASWEFIGNTGWLLLLGYSALVMLYIHFREPYRVKIQAAGEETHSRNGGINRPV